MSKYEKPLPFVHPLWQGQLTKIQAISLIDQVTDLDDPFWENLVGEFYDEETDTMPTIGHVLIALGITESEYKEATGCQNPNWPISKQRVLLDVD